MGFHPTFHKRVVRSPCKPIWALCIAKQEEIRLFFARINPCIKLPKALKSDTRDF